MNINRSRTTPVAWARSLCPTSFKRHMVLEYVQPQPIQSHLRHRPPLHSQLIRTTGLLHNSVTSMLYG